MSGTNAFHRGESPTRRAASAPSRHGRVVVLGADSLLDLAPALIDALQHALGVQVCVGGGRAVPGAAETPIPGRTALLGAVAVLLLARATQNHPLDNSLAWLRRVNGHCPVLVLGDALHMGAVQRLLTEGGGDFVLLPACEHEVVLRLQRLLARGIDSPSVSQAATDAPPVPSPMAAAQRHLIGHSGVFLTQLERVQRMAAHDASVLIQGETGTGKELFAQSIHYQSARAGRALVAVNCGAIPGELVEDELFGHVCGAYTTALQARTGLVREAEGGTLFLDDIDCLPLAAQAKLLRFLQEREYRSVGSNSVHRADVRVISASNVDLGALAQTGRFRADLYYRLNVLSLRLPPLRERREDIAPLAMHFVQTSARRFKRAVTGITPRALLRLCAHGWPGNVRELQHVVDRAVLLSTQALIDVDDIELDTHGRDASATAPAAPAVGTSAVATPEPPLSDATFREQKAQLVRDFERAYLQQLLASTQGNVAQAARTAGKDRRALFELIRKHRIDPERFRASVG